VLDRIFKVRAEYFKQLLVVRRYLNHSGLTLVNQISLFGVCMGSILPFINNFVKWQIWNMSCAGDREFESQRRPNFIQRCKRFATISTSTQVVDAAFTHTGLTTRYRTESL